MEQTNRDALEATSKVKSLEVDTARLKLFQDTLRNLSLQATLILGFSLSTYGADMLPVILDDTSNFCFYKNGWNMLFGSIYLFNNTANVCLCLLVMLSSSYIALKSQTALLYVGGSAAVWRTQMLCGRVYRWYGYALVTFITNACLLAWLFLGFGVWVDGGDWIDDDDDDDDEVGTSDGRRELVLANGVDAEGMAMNLSLTELRQGADEPEDVDGALGGPARSFGRLLQIARPLFSLVRRGLKKKKKKLFTEDGKRISSASNSYGSLLYAVERQTYAGRSIVKCMDLSSESHHQARDTFGYVNAAISQVAFCVFLWYSWSTFMEWERLFASDRARGGSELRLQERAEREKANLIVDVEMATIRLEEARKAKRRLERSLQKMERRAVQLKARQVARAAKDLVDRDHHREATELDAHVTRSITRQQTIRRAELTRVETALRKAEKKLAKAVSRRIAHTHAHVGI